MLSNFSSVFEIFCGINFAFVISNDFSNALFGKIISNFEKYNQTRNLCKDLVEEIKIHLGEKEKIKEVKAIKSIDDLASAFQILNRDFESNLNPYEKRIQKLIENKSFNHYSLLAGLYSLFILILTGFDFEKRPIGYHEVFFVLNFITVVLAFVIFSSKIRLFNSTYLISILYLPIILLFIATVGMVISIIYPCHVWFYDKIWNLIFPLLIVSGHFIYLFFKSLYYKYLLGSDYERAANTEFEKIKAFQNEVRTTFKVLNNLTSK